MRAPLNDDVLYFLRPEERLRYGPDPALVERNAPTHTTKEIPAYVFWSAENASSEEARQRREKEDRPDPTCADHGCDMVRYFMEWFYGERRGDLSPPEPPKAPPQYGTAGWVLDLPEIGQ